MFRPDARAIGARKRALCREAGLEGLFPLDDAAASMPGERPEDRPDRRIFRANLALLRGADLGLFDLTPFRGASADAGTVFELGAMAALGRPVFAYSADPRSLLDRVRALGPCQRTAAGSFDADGMAIEDHGEADNLMITAALAEAGTAVALPLEGGADDPDGLGPFRRCLREAARRMEAVAAAR